MRHADAVPSQVMDTYWIGCDRMDFDYPENLEDCGKWMIFRPKPQIDELWPMIRDAVTQGRLGSAAKVSTGKPNPNSRNPNDGAIMVYTYSAGDRQDAMRVRETLRQLGVTWKIGYKLDSDTLAGKYARNANGRVSIYWE